MKAIFLDRDGVINKYPGDRDYVKSWDEFQFLPGATDALSRLAKNNFGIFVISNQAGVAKGVYPKENLDLITKNMEEELKKRGVRISGIYYCTHHPDQNCACRKPKTGLLEMAVSESGKKGIDIDIEKSYFIGDTERDIEAGKVFGLKTILVFSGKEKPGEQGAWQYAPDFTAADLPEAANIILQKQ